jgi:hypothetical protein
MSHTQGHSAVGRMSTRNSNDAIRNQTCDLLACSTMPQPTAPPYNNSYSHITTVIVNKYFLQTQVITSIWYTKHQPKHTTYEGHFNTVYMNNSTSLYIQKWVWVICWLLGCSCISQRSARESTVPLTNRQCQGLWDVMLWSTCTSKTVGWKLTNFDFISCKMKTHIGMWTSCRPTQLSADILRRDGDQMIWPYALLALHINNPLLLLFLSRYQHPPPIIQ